MNPSSHDPMSNGPSAGLNVTEHPVDATLWVIANLPIPEGLDDRIRATLRTAPRRGSLLTWPLRVDTGWMRTAAAAAIVGIVAGGGWSVYSRVDRPQPAKVITMPAPGAASGGFSSAGAMRTPTTLNGPVLKHPVKKPAAKGKKVRPAAAGQSAQDSATANDATPAVMPSAK